MNRKANINGREYTLLEIVPSLDGGQALLLCEDENGKKATCSESLWCSCTLTDVQSAPVHAHSSSQEKIEYFLSVFKGREDVYARRYHSTTTGKTGYTPVCKNEWVHGLCDKKKYRCAECPNREFRPLTADVVKAHLIGRDSLCRDVAAIYPMLADNRTWLLAADFDEENWKFDVTAFCKSCKDAGLVPAVERSRSGNGAHVWFLLSFSSYDRLFPSQDLVPKGGFGNLIALPFQGQAQKDGNSLFVDDRFEPYPDQWAFLSSLPRITPEQLEEALRKLCHHGDVGELADAEEKQVPWKRKRTQTKLTRRDFPLQVSLYISNLIYIEKKDFSQAALNTLKRLAAFPNPEFRSKQAMRISVYGIPRVLDCGYEDENYIGIPRGCIEALLGLFDQYEVPAILEDHRSLGHSIDVEFNGMLRPEQEPAARALLAADIGVLSATTAFGKTVIGAYLIAQRKVNTLVLVQSSALLEQWKSSLEQFLNIHEVLPELPKKRGRKKKRHLIGQIGSGKNTRSGIVDIATMQSLLKGEEKTVKSFVAEYGMVIVDECHHVAAFTFETVLKAVEAKYVYGLSATPVRKDGHHPIIFMQCGPVRYLVDAKSQAEKRSFSHIVIPRFTRMRLPDANRIQDMYAGVIENHNRNELLVSDTLKLVQEGRTPILLTERKEHAVLLANQMSDQVKHVFLLIGSDKQKDKREKLTALQNMPDDEDVVVVATGKYIGEGFDAPRLDTLLLAMPISWKGTLAQYAGRLHRNYEGKQEVRIYDYVDIHVPTLERMYHKRLKGYAELGYQVKFGAADQSISVIYDGHSSMLPFEQDLDDAACSVVIVSPYLQKGRFLKLLPTLQKAVASGVKIAVHTRTADSRELSNQESVCEAIKMLEQTGIVVHTHKELNQRYAVVDESVVWYGGVDFLAFGRKDADVLRFKNPDIAGELLSLSGHAGSEQFVMEDVYM